MSKEDFDFYFYIKAYPDAKNLSKEEALKHYLNYGKKEGRLCKKPSLPKEFDWLSYVTFNEDLKLFKNFESAAVHFVKYGQYEKRIINVNQYIESNKKYEILGDYKGEFENILKNEAEAFKKITEYFTQV